MTEDHGQMIMCRRVDCKSHRDSYTCIHETVWIREDGSCNRVEMDEDLTFGQVTAWLSRKKTPQLEENCKHLVCFQGICQNCGKNTIPQPEDVLVYPDGHANPDKVIPDKLVPWLNKKLQQEDKSDN